MDPNSVLDAAAEGAKALTKLGEIIQKVFNPRWTRKQDQANAEADERRLQMIRDNPDMEIIYVNGQMSARQRTQEELFLRAEQRKIGESIREELNIEKVLEATVNNLKDTTTVSDDPVDDDWITRLFGIIKEISNEEMQQVWGKILAGEIQHPGSFSLRTLDTIRNLTTREASLFQKTLPYVMCLGAGDAFITSTNDILNKYGITFDDILELDEAGLVKSTVHRTALKVSNNKPLCVSNKKYTMVLRNTNDEAEIVYFSRYQYTKAGYELYMLLSVEANLEYDCMLAETIAKNNTEVEVSVNTILSKTNGSVTFVPTPIVVYRKKGDNS